jgi:hypothetical protein
MKVDLYDSYNVAHACTTLTTKAPGLLLQIHSHMRDPHRAGKTSHFGGDSVRVAVTLRLPRLPNI